MKEYLSDSLIIIIPDNLKIKQQAPQFFAEAKKPWLAVVVSIGDDDVTHEFTKTHLKNGPIQNAGTNLSLILNHEIESPHKGWEQISQITDTETKKTFAGWRKAIKIRKNYNAYISIEGEVDFESSRKIWRRVMDSVRILK